MNESQTEFIASGASLTQTEKVFATLAANAGNWVGMPHLVEVSGAYAVHSRVADLRRRGYNVENQVDRSTKPFKSFYRLLP